MVPRPDGVWPYDPGRAAVAVQWSVPKLDGVAARSADDERTAQRPARPDTSKKRLTNAVCSKAAADVFFAPCSKRNKPWERGVASRLGEINF